MAKPIMATAPVPTGGILFNRKMPRGEDGADVPMLGRDMKEQDGKTWLFNNGKDFTSMADDAKGKRRIPLTCAARLCFSNPPNCTHKTPCDTLYGDVPLACRSVVNRVGDCGVGGLTAAQVSRPSISPAHNTNHMHVNLTHGRIFGRSSGCSISCAS